MDGRKRAWIILKPLLKIGFTILALWLVYTKVDIVALRRLWKEANSWWLVPAVVAFVLCQGVTSVRLLHFFRNIGLPISMRSNFRLFLLGMFYNLFLPGGIGGDGYKIVVLKQRYPFTTRKEIFSAVFFDRLSGLWALCLLMALFGIVLPRIGQYSRWVLPAVAAGTVVYYWVLRRFFKRISRHFFEIHLMAVCTQLLQLVTVAFMLNALGCKASYWPYFTIFLASSLASLFPFSVGGLGAREVVIVWGATILGLDKDLAVSISLSFYLITMAMALTAIPVLFRKEQIRPEEESLDAAEQPIGTR